MNSEENYGDQPGNSEQTISQKIQDLEIELNNLRKYQKEFKHEENNSIIQKWNGIFFIIIILTMVSIPSILVFLDKWLNLPEVKNYSRDYLCKIEFLCIDGLPGYFFWIMIFLIISALVVFTYGDVFSPFLSSIFRNFKEEKNEHHYKVNKTLIIAFLFLILEIAINILIKRIPGAELLLIILLFYIYFVSNEEKSMGQKFLKILTSMNLLIKENSFLIATIIFSFVYLFLFIKNYYESFGHIKWIFFVFLLPILFMLKSQIKNLHPLFWLSLFVIVFYSYQMDNWLYSKIGDEYAFFYFARDLINRPYFWQLSNMFSLDGVYGTHSVLSSIISNIFMRFLGFDHYGWIFSNYFLVLSSIIIFFFIIKEFFNQKIALVSVLFLSFSSYIIGFSRIGYNNLQALFFGSIAIFISGRFIKNKSRSNAFLTGISMGFLLYTFQAAFFYIPIIFIFFLLFNPPKSKIAINDYLVTLLGLLLLCVPILFQPDFMEILNQGTFYNKSYLVESSDTIFSHLKSNLLFSLFSYIYLFKESHYVMNSMIDPITAVFFVIGLLVAIKNFLTDKRFQFIVITYFLLILSIGMIHDYPAPPITRLFIILPWMYFIAAIGLYLIGKLLLSVNIMSKKWINITSVILILFIFAVNFLQSSVIVQNKYAYYYFEPVIFKVMQFNTRNLYNRSELPANYLFLTPDNYDLHWMNMIQDVYNIPESKVQLHRIIYSTQGISEDWESKIESDNELFIFAPTSFSEDILNQISVKMAEKGRNLCQLRYRKDSPIMAYMWINPEKQFVCDELLKFN